MPNPDSRFHSLLFFSSQQNEFFSETKKKAFNFASFYFPIYLKIQDFQSSLFLSFCLFIFWIYFRVAQLTQQSWIFSSKRNILENEKHHGKVHYKVLELQQNRKFISATKVWVMANFGQGLSLQRKRKLFAPLDRKNDDFSRRGFFVHSGFQGSTVGSFWYFFH